MKTVNIDFTDSTIGTLGRAGEHNNTEVVFNLTQDLADCDMIFAEVGTESGEKIPVEGKHDSDSKTFTILLTDQLTVEGRLTLQLVGYVMQEGSDEPQIIAKSPLVSGAISKSINGIENEAESRPSLLHRIWAKISDKLHIHSNFNTLDAFSCDMLDNPITDGDFNFGVNAADWHRLKFQGGTVLFSSDGAVVQKVEEKEIDGQKFFRVYLNKPGLVLDGGDMPSFFDIPVKAVEGKFDLDLNSGGLELELLTDGEGNGDLSQFIEETASSVNLYPPTTEGWTNSATLQSSGAIATNTKDNSYVTPQILIEPNTTYTVNDVFGWSVNTGLADKNKGRAYTANNTALADIVFTLNADGSYTFTTPEGSAYIRFMGYKGGLVSNSKAPIETVIEQFNAQFMLVKGTSVPSVYEPYGKGGYRFKDIEIPLQSVKLENVNDKALPIFAPLAGKKIANFGDSIFGNARPPEDVSTYLAEKTGAEVLNCAFGGCRMAIHNQLGHWNAFTMVQLAQAISSGDYSVQDEALNYEDRTSYAEQPLSLIKATDFSTVDILTIAYGTNDFTSNIPLENAENPYDTTTLAGALRTAIESLLTAYPNLKIFVLSTMYRFYIDDNNEFTEDSNTRVNSIGLKLGDYNAKLKEVAGEYNLPYVDDYNVGIGEFNRLQYFNANDGAHHNKKGRRLIAEHLATALSMGNNIPDSSIDKVIISTSSAKLNANKVYEFGMVTELNITFASNDLTKYNEYNFTFISGATPTVLTLPSSVQWANELTVEANKRYEISIVDNIGLWCAVEVSG